jgi:5'-3' exonuclease
LCIAPLFLSGCLLGDQSDAIRGLPHYVPQFGANSAHKLIEKFTSVKELLDAAKVRTIGRPYMQEAVLTYAKVLELNETLITLRR